MALGTMLVSKLGAVVTYVKARVDIKLDYDSKNVKPTDSISIDDSVQVDFTIGKFFTDLLSLVGVPSVAMTKLFTDTVGTGDALVQTIGINIIGTISVKDTVIQYSDGMFNTAALNTRMMHGGSTALNVDDVLITIT